MLDLHVHITRRTRSQSKLERASWVASVVACIVAGMTLFGFAPSNSDSAPTVCPAQRVVVKTVVIYRDPARKHLKSPSR